ncbi:hypothetical protein CF326_g9474 [Tilletia indica]|nr:hypothetical protein CF326_g9474 [Tilletia indica]
MASTPTNAPARNTRSGGPTMDEFRALESGQATLANTLNEQIANLRNRQAADIESVRGQLQSTANEHKARLDSLQTGIDSILATVGQPSTVQTDPASPEAPQTTTVSAATPTAPVVSASTTSNPPSTDPSRAVDTERSALAGGSVPSAPNRQVYTVKSEDISTFDGTPENLELFLARIQSIRFAENDASWDRAVLRAIPLALRGRAAIWHSTLTDRQRANLCRFDAWYEALRENFSPHPSVVRRLARQRAWDPDVEDILGYVFAKVALLKVAYPGYNEGEVVQEVAERLPVDIQMLLRQPQKRQPTLANLRAELRVQEVFWRHRHNRPLLNATPAQEESLVSQKRTTAFTELATPAALAIAPMPSSSSSARGSVAQRRGKPYAEDFDPSRLGQGKSPRTGKDTVFYRVPETTETIWCERPCRRCGGNHFDFSHDHFTSKPQVRFAEEEEDDGYPAASYVADSNDRDDSTSF